MHWTCPCVQMHAKVCVSQQAHTSTQVTTTMTHTPQCTTPTNLCASLTDPSKRLMYNTARPRVPCRGLARCSGHDRNDGPAAVGWQQQLGHHARKRLAVGKPCLGPAQVLVHDSQRPAGGDEGVFCLAHLISDLSPLPGLLGEHSFTLATRGAWAQASGNTRAATAAAMATASGVGGGQGG
jgi:hypothetical protein